MHARLQAVLLLVLLLTVGAFAGSALSQWWQRAPGPMAAPGSPGSTTPGASIDGRVRVEVLNGGGMPNMARSATDELRDSGFDVVYFGNADRFDHDSSFVVARTERLDWARAVADRLGIREVRSEPDDNLYLDVTVVLGREWQPRPVSETPPVADEDGRPWWDPRTWVPRRPMSPGASRHLADPARDDETEGPIDASDDSAASVGPDTGEPRE